MFSTVIHVSPHSQQSFVRLRSSGVAQVTGTSFTKCFTNVSFRETATAAHCNSSSPLALARLLMCRFLHRSLGSQSVIHTTREN